MTQISAGAFSTVCLLFISYKRCLCFLSSKYRSENPGFSSSFHWFYFLEFCLPALMTSTTVSGLFSEHCLRCCVIASPTHGTKCCVSCLFSLSDQLYSWFRKSSQNLRSIIRHSSHHFPRKLSPPLSGECLLLWLLWCPLCGKQTSYSLLSCGITRT